MKSVGLVWIVALLATMAVHAQTNPVPFIDQPLVPTAVAPGAAGFTLAVNGANFVAGSVVNWNGASLPTTFISRAQLTATVAAADVASARTAFVTVVNPTPGGGVSNVAFFQVATPESTVVLSQTNNIASDVFSVITADFNGDGKLDLAAAGFDSQNNPTLYILLGNGDGTFQEGTTLPASIGSLLAAGDFNGDGKLDVAGFDDNTTSELTVMLGNGDGTFQAQTPIQLLSPAVYYFDATVSADFNGDGVLDLVLSGDTVEHGQGQLLTLLGNGDGTFQAALLGGDGAQGSFFGEVAADFNGDGQQDLASSFAFGQSTEPQTPGFAVGLGNGAVRFYLQ